MAKLPETLRFEQICSVNEDNISFSMSDENSSNELENKVKLNVIMKQTLEKSVSEAVKDIDQLAYKILLKTGSLLMPILKTKINLLYSKKSVSSYFFFKWFFFF